MITKINKFIKTNLLNLITKSQFCQYFNMNTQKTYLSKISNILFIIFNLFLITFIWLNYYLRNFKLSVTSTIVIVICFCIIYFPIKHKKNKLKSFSKEKQILKEQFQLNLLLGKTQDNITFLCNIFNIQNTDTTKHEYHLATKDSDYFFILNKEMLSDNDIITTLKSRMTNNITIFCINSQPFQKIKDINIKIIKVDEIFNQFTNSNNSNLEEIKIEKKPKIRGKDYLGVIFNKNRARGYLTFGSLLLLSSIFTPYNTYYIITGTILLLASIFSRFNKSFN